MAEMNDRIVPLEEMDDFEVADGDPDVRGWNVIASDGRTIGEVDQLLVDTAALRVRYLDVDLSDDLDEGEPDRHILIPIGYARLDEDDDQVYVDQLSTDQIRTLPAYSHEPITRDYETDLRQRFDTGFPATSEGQTAAATGEDFYAHDLYDEDRFYGSRRSNTEERQRGEGSGERHVMLSREELSVGKREVPAGEVEIDKEVETRHVRREVPVEHEEVVVERRPATPGMSAEARIEGDEVHIPVTEEEIVTEKRVVPREELVVRKRGVEQNETVEADLREERADIRREGDVRLSGDIREDERRR
ncbi:MAG TPA: DUF2382 domain-containing protein [Longimicrobiaceae bacterium]|nr:DUF2382 domain-containing protein [Longimicrobiaceae bacterium]